MTNKKTPPIWKQVLGASVGGALALGLYASYEFVEPFASTAYVTFSQSQMSKWLSDGEVSTADRSLSEEEYNRIKTRTSRALNSMVRAKKNDPTDYDMHLSAGDEFENQVAYNMVDYDEGADLWDHVQNTSEQWNQREQVVSGTVAFQGTTQGQQLVSGYAPTTYETVYDTQWEPSWDDIPGEVITASAVDVAAITAGANQLPNSGLGASVMVAMSLFGAGATSARRLLKEKK